MTTEEKLEAKLTQAESERDTFAAYIREIHAELLKIDHKRDGIRPGVLTSLVDRILDARDEVYKLTEVE